MAANGDSVPLSSVGLVATPSVSLSNVYFIPSLSMNLAYVGQICNSGHDVWFYVSNCFIHDRQIQEVIGTCRREGGLYVLDNFKDPSDITVSTVDLYSYWLNRSSSVFYLWHSRLGHVYASILKFLVSSRALRQLESHDILDCNGCKLEKFTALPFNKSVSFSNASFDLVHYDFWGPSLVSFNI